MRIPDFELERWKAKYILPGVIDLTETGIPSPLLFKDIFVKDALDLRLDYASIYGNEDLRREVAELYAGAKKDNILITSSTSESNFIGVNMILNSGDEVLSVQPAFMQIPGLLEANGVRLREYLLEEENGFELDVNRLNETMSDKVRVIALNFPNNPTGRTLTKSQVKGVVEIAKDHDAWIVCDEVYRGIEFEGSFSPSFAEYYDKAVCSSSLSKVWGAPGLRVGWMIGPKDIIERGSALKEYTTLGGSVLSEFLAARMLQKKTRDKLVARGRKQVQESFTFYSKWMSNHKGVFSWIPPKFGVISLIKHNLPVSSNEFCMRLLKEKSVGVVPADTCFPKIKNADRYMRLSYCHPPAIMRDALSRIDEVIDELKPKVAAG